MDCSTPHPSSLTCVSSSTPVPLMSTADLSTWLRAASPASRSAPPAKDSPKPTSETCGPRPSSAFAEYDPVTHSWRTFQGCLLSRISEPYSQTWPRAGIACDGIVCQQAPLAPITRGTGSGSSPHVADFPTPATTAYGSSGNGTGNNVESRGRPSLETMARRQMWPTPLSVPTSKASHGQLSGRFRSAMAEAMKKWPSPRASDAERGGRGELLHMAKGSETPRGPLWPMPTAGDAKASGAAGYSTTSGRHAGVTLTDAAVRGFATPQSREYRSGSTKRWEEARKAERSCNLNDQIGGKLNPRWVEWLMKWPIGWASLEPLETAKFQQWRHSHGNG